MRANWNKIYSSAATLGLHSRVKMQTISYGGRQMPCFLLASTKSFVCQFISVILSDFFQLSVGTKMKMLNAVLRLTPFYFPASSVRRNIFLHLLWRHSSLVITEKKIETSFVSAASFLKTIDYLNTISAPLHLLLSKQIIC